MKKVIIDARLSGLKHAGIGRYTEMLCEHLYKLQIPNSKFQIQTFAPHIRHYSLAEQFLLVPELLKLNPDLVHFPHFNVPLLYRKPFVVTIHDLLWHDQVGMDVTTLPAWLYSAKYLGYRLVMHHAISDSKAIIVPSHWVEGNVLERFPNASGRIHVIYEGVSEAFKDASEKVGPSVLKVRPLALKRYELTSLKFLIYTGSLYPHKNVDLVLNVLKHFPDLKFVVACSRNVFWEKFREKVKKMGLEDRVTLAGFVPDDELVILYRRAFAFVFPSLSEGFGLPALEAMAAGCPVLSSNATALPEIYGNAALYFDPKSEEDLVKKIKRIRDEKETRKRIIAMGKERVKQFTWEQCAEETMKIYFDVLEY